MLTSPCCVTGFFFFSSRRRHTRCYRDWSSDVCSSDLLPICRALTPTQEERMIRELILQMKLGHVHRAYFQGKFGVDIQQRFADSLSKLQDRGFLALDENSLRLNRAGMLQVDMLLHEFFLPQHRNARYT